MNRPSLIAPLLLFVAGTLFSGCDRQRAVVDYAEDMLEAGEFERALELINRVDSIHNTPELDAMRGTILSLEPSTMVDGIFLMNRTVDGLDDPRLRRNLFQLYLDTKLYTNAGQLVSGERVGPEKFFRRDIVRMRSVMRCFEYPDPASAKKLLEDLPRKEEKSDEFFAPARDSSRLFALLCLGRGIRNASKEADLYWVLDSTKRDEKVKSLPAYSRPQVEGLVATFQELMTVPEDDDLARRNRCEMMARMGSEDVSLPPPDAVQQELSECRKSYPGSLVLRRIWPANLDGLNAEKGGPMLFDESPFFPVYVPRPEFEPVAEDSLPDPNYPVIRPQ